MCDLDVEDVQSWVESTDTHECYNCDSGSLTVKDLSYDEFFAEPLDGISPYRVELSCTDCFGFIRVNLRWSSVAEIDSSVVVAGVI